MNPSEFKHSGKTRRTKGMALQFAEKVGRAMKRSALSGESRIHGKAFMYGLKAVPFRKMRAVSYEWLCALVRSGYGNSFLEGPRAGGDRPLTRTRAASSLTPFGVSTRECLLREIRRGHAICRPVRTRNSDISKQLSDGEGSVSKPIGLQTLKCAFPRCTRECWRNVYLLAKAGLLLG